MELKPGTRLASTVCETQVAIVKASAAVIDVACGGSTMVTELDAPRAGAPASGLDAGTQIGKRYVVPEGDDTLELLCTRAGAGTLSAGGVALVVKDAKPLPSSD